MKKTRLKFSLLSLLVIAGLLLAACAPTSQPTNAPSEPENVVEGPDTADPGDEPAGEEHEPVTITYWHVGAFEPLQGATDHLIAEFEKQYPWITVNVEGFPFSEYFQKVDMATAGETAPDVYWVDSTYATKYWHFDMVLPLDDLAPADYVDDYFENVKQDAMYRDGHLIAIPLHQSTEQVLYNADLVAEAGLEPPKTWEDAWTMDEYRDALEKVSKIADDGTVEVWAATQNYRIGFYSLQPKMAAMGSTFTDPTEQTFLGYMDSDKMVENFTWYCDLFRDMLSPIEKAPDIFESGHAVFYEANPFVLVDIQNRYPDLNVGVMPLPCGETCAVQSGSYHIGIHSQSDNPEEAWLLIEFLTSYEGHKYWVETTHYIPARISVYEEMDFLKEYPWNIYMDGLINYAVHRPGNMAWPMVNAETPNLINNCATGADPRAELQKYAQMFEEELSAYK